MGTHIFHTSCVNSTAERIHEMVDLEHELTGNQFIYGSANRAGIVEDVLDRLGYTAWGKDCGRSPRALFAEDFALSCHRSWFMGFPCLYVRHSAIEYVYVESSNREAILKLEAMESSRESHKDDLENQWDELKVSADLLDVPLHKALLRFADHHKATLTDWRIPLRSFVCPGTDAKLERTLWKLDLDLLN
jgi:hypothetical protein